MIDKSPTILALMGSPRRGGNTETLLDSFLSGIGDGGGEAEIINAASFEIAPCAECLDCEKTGQCVIRDDMDQIYPRLLRAERLVIASPIFFYGLPAQLKALIDRCQALWYRRQLEGKFKEALPARAFLLLLGATRGKKLFDGALLTLKYFLQALGGGVSGKLLYREIENKGDIRDHPTALEDAYQAGRDFIGLS